MIDCLYHNIILTFIRFANFIINLEIPIRSIKIFHVWLYLSVLFFYSSRCFTDLGFMHKTGSCRNKSRKYRMIITCYFFLNSLRFILEKTLHLMWIRKGGTQSAERSASTAGSLLSVVVQMRQIRTWRWCTSWNWNSGVCNLFGYNSSACNWHL